MLALALLLATPLEIQRSYEACLEAAADRAARAGVAPDAFDADLPELCAAEEAALVDAVVIQRADRDPALTRRPLGLGEPDGRAMAAARGYADGLRGVVAAGYPTLLQLRGPRPDPNRYPYGGPVGGGPAGGTPPPASGVPRLLAGGVPPPLAGGVPPLGGSTSRTGTPPLGPSIGAAMGRPRPRRIVIGSDGAVRARPVADGSVADGPVTERPSMKGPAKDRPATDRLVTNRPVTDRSVMGPPAPAALATRLSPAPGQPRPSPRPRHVRVPPG